MQHLIFYSIFFSMSLKLDFSCFRGMLNRFRNGAGSLTTVALLLNYQKSKVFNYHVWMKVLMVGQ
jgi:hypothetical protein